MVIVFPNCSLDCLPGFFLTMHSFLFPSSCFVFLCIHFFLSHFALKFALGSSHLPHPILPNGYGTVQDRGGCYPFMAQWGYKSKMRFTTWLLNHDRKLAQQCRSRLNFPTSSAAVINTIYSFYWLPSWEILGGKRVLYSCSKKGISHVNTWKITCLWAIPSLWEAPFCGPPPMSRFLSDLCRLHSAYVYFFPTELQLQTNPRGGVLGLNIWFSVAQPESLARMIPLENPFGIAKIPVQDLQFQVESSSSRSLYWSQAGQGLLRLCPLAWNNSLANAIYDCP